MPHFKDKTFCASTNCVNDCGRKMNAQEKAELDQVCKNNPSFAVVSWAYFCDENGRVPQSSTQRAEA